VDAAVLASGEVRDALAAGGAVVALETSVLAQGLPHPRNLEAARAMEARIRSAAAVPAWVAVADGRIRVGLSSDEVDRLASPGADVAKVARRDYPAAVAGGGLGATTVSATLWAAHRAGIEVMATGGVGGVHPGTWDVSADLLEMARTPGTVVCSGPKSIVDPAATLERLEELGILVVGYGTDRLPFFLAADSGLELEHRVDQPAAAAAVAAARRDLGVESAVLLCNPISPDHAMDPASVADAVAACEAEAERRGVRGKDVTPFLLGCLSERTNGASLEANLALLEANAAVAAEIAVEVARLA
jgi:pseudouridylate synthase